MFDACFATADRELHDRWLEKVNGNPSLLSSGKYDVSRAIESRLAPVKMLAA